MTELPGTFEEQIDREHSIYRVDAETDGVRSPVSPRVMEYTPPADQHAWVALLLKYVSVRQALHAR